MAVVLSDHTPTTAKITTIPVIFFYPLTYCASLYKGCVCCCHSAVGNMQGAENWFTGRDLDFSITQHTRVAEASGLETTLIGLSTLVYPAL